MWGIHQLRSWQVKGFFFFKQDMNETGHESNNQLWQKVIVKAELATEINLFLHNNSYFYNSKLVQNFYK